MFLKPIIPRILLGAFVCNLGTPPSLYAGAETLKMPVQWVLTPTCTQLNPGVASVTGEGEQHFTVHTRKRPDGTITMEIQSVASGNAVDNTGNRYRWSYVNHLAFSLDSYLGHFTDRFDLVSLGNMPNLKVRLSWDLIVDPDHLDLRDIIFSATVIPIETDGDPSCDPI